MEGRIGGRERMTLWVSSVYGKNREEVYIGEQLKHTDSGSKLHVFKSHLFHLTAV